MSGKGSEVTLGKRVGLWSCGPSAMAAVSQGTSTMLACHEAGLAADVQRLVKDATRRLARLAQLARLGRAKVRGKGV